MMSSRLGPKEGWATVVLLFVMLLCVAWSIQSAEWTEGLSVLQGVVLLGCTVGIVLAKSRTPNALSHLLSALMGFTWAAYLTSRVLAQASRLQNILPVPAGLPAVAGIAEGGLPLDLATAELQRQFGDWFYALFTGATSAGNYVFIFLLAFLLWVLAYSNAWAIFRWQRVWWAVILCSLAMLLNITYAPVSLTGYMLVFLLAALLLVVRTNLASHQQEWDAARVSYDADIVYGFLRAGLVVSLCVIVLAWVAPSALASRPFQETWKRVGEPWRRLQDQSSRIFQALNYRNEPAFVTFGLATKFGGAVNLSADPVMDVKSPYGRYWRVIAFHEYASDGWVNTDEEIISLGTDKLDQLYTGMQLRLDVTQTITLRQDLSSEKMIAAAGQPLRGQLPLLARISYITGDQQASQSRSSGPLPPDMPGDATVLYAQEPLKAGDSYQVGSSITIADEESMRRAPIEYPPWIVPRYLQLPTTLPRRVRVLAEEVAAGRETPYDKAVAIESYLRNIPYNQNIEGPKAGQDGVDYFLFEAKEGYCDYYASAMVTMLRAVNVPARYVRGYSLGEFDNGIYHVLARDSHAWAEVYFPGHGWVEFEPTSAEPVIIRPSPRDDTVMPRPTPEMEDAERLRDRDDLFGRGSNVVMPTPPPEPLIQRIGRWVGWGLALFALVTLAVALILVRRRRQREGLSAAEWTYEKLVIWVRRLFRLSPLAHQTPFEYAGAVGGAMGGGHPAIERVADFYVQERFGGRVAAEGEVSKTWRQAGPILWQRWVQRKVGAVRRVWRRFVVPPELLEEEEDVG
jgi:transglutaminase-like putative cysteine protease